MKKLFVALLVLSLFSTVSYSEPTIYKNKSGVMEKMLYEKFWIRRANNPDKILMTKEQINELSNKVKKSKETACVDIFSYSEIITKEKLVNLINTFKFSKEARYNGETLIDSEYIVNLKKQRNEKALSSYNIVRFGTVIRETQIRAFPTSDAAYTEPNDVEFDMNIESVLKVWEPLAFLHTSLNGEWELVQSSTCLGWVRTEDTAITNKTRLRKLLERDFITVTANRITTDVDHSNPSLSPITLTMGTYLPLADKVDTISDITTQYSYTVILPERDSDGNLVEKISRIPFNADVQHGYLPYTQKNIIKQAFKLLGERYGWGGLWNARDCSSFVKDIYSTFGIQLPRNSANQARIPSLHFDVSDLNAKDKTSLIMEQPVGTLLRKKGHIMLYLGHYNRKPYVIHNAYSYGESGKNGQYERMKINSVVISDLEITLKDKTLFIDSIIDINTIN